MAARRMPLRILAPAGVAGIGLFLYVRHLQGADFRLADWIIAGSAVMMSVLILCGSRPRSAAGSDSEEPPAGNGQRKWPVGLALLPLLIWIVYSSSMDSPDPSRKRGERKQTATALPDAAESPRMIRTLAGEPDDTGWVPAVSTAGGFSVCVPDRFNEAISALRMEGRVTPVVILGTRMGDWKFVAFAARLSGKDRDMKARAKDAAKSLVGFKNAVVTREGLFEDKFPLIEIEMNTHTAGGLSRVIATDQAVYGLTVEGPELTDGVRADAAKFFDSFAIVASDPSGLMGTDASGGGESN